MPDKPSVAQTYDRAADVFDTLPFWHHFGRLTVERIGLTRGARVIDLCCGSGASALPAAQAVGREGHVIGVDLSRELIAVARSNAAIAGLDNVSFRVADVEALEFDPGSFDAVVSVFGLFFVPDMAGMLARAWSWLAPGGMLAVTVWGEHVLEPGESIFWDAVRREDPSLRPVSPSARLTSEAGLALVFADAELRAPEIETITWDMPLPRAEDFWPCILGSSNRGVVEALAPEARKRVRDATLDGLRARGVSSLRCDAIVATCRRPVR